MCLQWVECSDERPDPMLFTAVHRVTFAPAHVLPTPCRRAIQFEPLPCFGLLEKETFILVAVQKRPISILGCFGNTR